MPSCASAFAGVRGHHPLRAFVGGFLVDVDLVVEHPLSETDDTRAEAQDLRDERVDRGVELTCRGHDVVHQTPVERGARVDRLPGEQHVQRASTADHARERHHRRGAEQADLHAGRREPRVLGRDGEVAGRDELAPSGRRAAVDLCDHGLRDCRARRA